MTTRRPLLTAAAAGSLLCALWFVPSANASVADPGSVPDAARTQVSAPSEASLPASSSSHPTPSDSSSTTSDGANLADSGSINVTPYLIGGTGFLTLGVAMVTVSVRRTRTLAY